MASSINLDKGNVVSDLEGMFLCLEAILQDKISQQKPKGIILGRGQANEKRMTYIQIKGILKEFKDYMGMKGAFSFGVCDTCSKFDTRGHTPDYFGSCGSNLMHRLDCCPQHSKKNGGFGV